jgi:amino acid adenylation domain-containing protein
MKNLSQLSAQKQELLQRLLAGNGIDASKRQTIPRRAATTAPLSYAQQRMWFVHQFDPDKALYNLPFALRLKGALDIVALQQALNEMIRRHEALRTTFADVNGSPVQIIQPAAPLDLAIIDLQQYSPDARDEELQRIISDGMQIPFDLSQGSLIRAKLLRMDDTEHVLLLTMHHIASDGWSLALITRELAQFYKAFQTGKASPLPELPVQYADYAAWQREAFQGPAIQQQLDYWKKQLAGLSDGLELPMVRPRPAVPDHHAARCDFHVSAALLHSLEEKGRNYGATTFMVFLAAFQVLLCRYSEQFDVAVGTPVAGRSLAETESLIGCFLNMLVMRASLAGNPTFSELLKRVRETALGAYSNQDLPFEKLVEELRPQRDLSSSPFFQVMFIFRNTPAREWSLPGLEIGEEKVAIDRELFDLTLIMKPNKSGMQVDILYRRDLFDPKLITRFASHFENLLQSIVSNPETAILNLPLLSRAEQDQLLEQWAHGSLEAPIDQCLHELFERQVERTPGKTALIAQQQSVSYAELNRQANQLAHYLRHAGVGPESLVAICVKPGTDMVTSMLGILKAGGSYLPLDFNYPPERLKYLLEDSGAHILLTQEVLLSRMPEFHGTIIRLDREMARIRQGSDLKPTNLSVSDNRAYVLYTSGSTGKPKGVEITHRALVNFLVAMQREPGITEDDLLLAVTTITFDIAGLELYLPLISGARVQILDYETRSDGRALLKVLSDEVTIMQATPATWTSLLNAGWTGSPRLKILCGGEALTPELAAKLLERGSLVWNMYGPTETTVWSLIQNLNSANHRVSIGKPVRNTDIYVLNREMEPVPVGVPGELYIGGAGVARGYLKRADLTAQKFLPLPFSRKSGERFYRTGDRVRWSPDGALEFMGRYDDQVKLRGHRIELGEVEVVLKENTGIMDAVALIREDQPGDQRLVAYVVIQPGSSADPVGLRALLKRKLPAYMLPSCVVSLERLPLTTSGKVDRQALPVPPYHLQEQNRQPAAPGTPTEEKLKKIWTDVLHLEKIEVHDSFWEMGGHSFLAMQIASRVQQVFRLELPLFVLFERPTIAEVAEFIDAQQQPQPRKRTRTRTKKTSAEPVV